MSLQYAGNILGDFVSNNAHEFPRMLSAEIDTSVAWLVSCLREQEKYLGPVHMRWAGPVSLADSVVLRSRLL